MIPPIYKYISGYKNDCCNIEFICYAGLYLFRLRLKSSYEYTNYFNSKETCLNSIHAIKQNNIFNFKKIQKNKHFNISNYKANDCYYGCPKCNVDLYLREFEWKENWKKCVNEGIYLKVDRTEESWFIDRQTGEKEFDCLYEYDNNMHNTCVKSADEFLDILYNKHIKIHLRVLFECNECEKIFNKEDVYFCNCCLDNTEFPYDYNLCEECKTEENINYHIETEFDQDPKHSNFIKLC